jgi:hypothetical protein
MTFWPLTLTFTVTLQIFALHWNASYYPVVFCSPNYMFLNKMQNLTSMTCDLDLNLTLQKDALFTYCITVLCFIAVEWPILFIYCFQIIKQIWPPWPWPVRYPKIEFTKSFLGSQWMHRPDYRKFWKFFKWFFSCTNIRPSSMEKKHTTVKNGN